MCEADKKMSVEMSGDGSSAMVMEDGDQFQLQQQQQQQQQQPASAAVSPKTGGMGEVDVNRWLGFYGFLIVIIMTIAIVALLYSISNTNTLSPGGVGSFLLEDPCSYLNSQQIAGAGQALGVITTDVKTGYISFDAASTDYNAGYWKLVGGDSASGTGFTPAVSGIYDLAYQVRMSTSTGGTASTWLTKNGTVIEGTVERQTFMQAGAVTLTPTIGTLGNGLATNTPLLCTDVIALNYSIGGAASTWLTAADTTPGSLSAATLTATRKVELNA